jgi:hypothetical protein
MTKRLLPGMSYQITLTDRDLACITEAFEAISGSASGDLVPDAPRMLAADPSWRESAVSLCERFDTALPPERRGDPVWQTGELRDLIIRGACQNEGTRHG